MLRAVITFDRAAMLAGQPCVIAGGERWPGFETRRGVVFIKTGDGTAWLEFHGDPGNLSPGGVVVEPANPDVREQHGWNYWVSSQLDRITAAGVTVGAVNRPRVAARDSSAVTVYQPGNRGLSSALVRWARFEGVIRSVVLSPPAAGPREPLNAWIETGDSHLVEVH